MQTLPSSNPMLIGKSGTEIGGAGALTIGDLVMGSIGVTLSMGSTIAVVVLKLLRFKLLTFKPNVSAAACVTLADPHIAIKIEMTSFRFIQNPPVGCSLMYRIAL